MSSKFFAAAASGLAAFAVASGAFAQAAAPLAKAPAAPAAPAVTHGAPIASLCVFSAGGVRGGSQTGKALDARIKALQTTAEQPLSAREKALQTKIDAFNAAAKTPAPDINAREKQKADLELEQSALQRDVAHMQMELFATNETAQQSYATELQPAVISAYQSKQCGVLLERSAVAIFNPAMDITPQIVAALDARGKAGTFQALERTKLTPQQAAQLAAQLQR
ncbi:outer membrane chaperone Skp [Caulobacter zeae]|uniref:Outer membrane chaperone Skp n=1 Tax=Caulobacter zeae TaxID=2055137 RepID=A0A2N5CZU6_9CAUL|nr:OmpH family outer membrane protein [Caulobacter zeae]PLR19312.1 outer membrane chaperone Skp [Caulobacter zeae]